VLKIKNGTKSLTTGASKKDRNKKVNPLIYDSGELKTWVNYDVEKAYRKTTMQVRNIKKAIPGGMANT